MSGRNSAAGSGGMRHPLAHMRPSASSGSACKRSRHQPVEETSMEPDAAPQDGVDVSAPLPWPYGSL
eukprot:6365284-Alexandrium_andersonii.AAC.1